MYDSQYYTTYSAQEAGGFFALIAGMMLFVFILAVASYVLTALGLMKFFEKAGKPSWAAWVPFYNVWIMAEVAAVEQYWFWIFVGGVVLGFIPVLGQLLSLAAVVGLVYITHNFLGKFGKDAGNTALAVLFPFAYYPIVGYSKDLKFNGKKAAAAKS
jgi:signal peptidase I